jgi:hypothetical protein
MGAEMIFWNYDMLDKHFDGVGRRILKSTKFGIPVEPAKVSTKQAVVKPSFDGYNYGERIKLLAIFINGAQVFPR